MNEYSSDNILIQKKLCSFAEFSRACKKKEGSKKVGKHRMKNEREGEGKEKYKK